MEGSLFSFSFLHFLRWAEQIVLMASDQIAPDHGISAGDFVCRQQKSLWGEKAI